MDGTGASGAANRNSTDRAARRAGLFLILTAAVTLVAVMGRVVADADRETLDETFAAIADARLPYALSGAGRLASGVTLVVAALFLYRTWIIRDRLASPIVPGFFALSGAFTTTSGLLAIVLAVVLPEGGGSATSTNEVIASVRWFTGVAGFSAAGIAILIASFFQYRVGGRLRFIAPISAVLGASMQLIWLPDIIAVHQITGIAFFVWLIVIGAMLLTGRVEQHYRAFANLKSH